MNPLSDREKLAFKACYYLALRAPSNLLSGNFKGKISFYDALTIVLEFLYFNYREDG